MAETDNTEKERSLIDPIYQKFVRGVTRAIGSTDFYEFFMDALSRAQNEFQFSNRKMIKSVDLTWVDAVEEALPAMQNIISSPRNVIKEEDLIVNVANAKRSTSETVRHLAMHSGLVESFDQTSGDVRPSRLMQRYREDSLGLYENRLIYTTMEQAYHFVKIRHDALLEAMSDEFGAKLKVCSDMESATEHVHLDMFLHIKGIDSALETDRKNGDAFARISRIFRVLTVYMNSSFAQQLSKLSRVKGSISKTNILKRNHDYAQVLKLFEFLRSYEDIGYTIRVVEQNPRIDAEFQENIYRNILFNYLILKGYLEDEDDRAIPAAAKKRGRKLKPKFVREIIEELTEDYDLPDVEIRKVLIEQLTKEQLMQEEAEERRRLVEEQERRRKEEEERLKAEKLAEAARLKAERAAEAERKRLEKEAAEEQRRHERMMREADDRRRKRLFAQELDRFTAEKEERLAMRRAAEEAARRVAEQEDYADAVRLLEEAEQRKKEEAARERQRRREEKERAEAARRLEEERLLQEQQAEAERIRREQEAEAERLAAAQREQDLIILQPLVAELSAFVGQRNTQAGRRQQQAAAERARQEEWERSRQARARNRIRHE